MSEKKTKKYIDLFWEFIDKYGNFFKEDATLFEKVIGINQLIKNNIITRFGWLISGFIYFVVLNFLGLMIFFYQKNKIDKEIDMFLIENFNSSENLVTLGEAIENIKVNIFFTSNIWLILKIYFGFVLISTLIIIFSFLIPFIIFALKS